MKVAVPLARASAIDGAIERTMPEQQFLRTGKEITLVISDKDDIIRIIKSIENLEIFNDRVSETVKQTWNKKTRRRISWYVIRNFRCFSGRKYVNWKSCSKC